MAEFDVAHVQRGGPAHRYAEGKLAVTKLSVGPYDNNVYILTDPDSMETLVVDAANEAERVIEQLRGLAVRGVATTHRHPDHTVALREVLSATGGWSGAHPADADDIPVRPDRPLEHGTVLTVGQFQVKVLHTPGHTDGSISFQLPHAQLLTGDALFPGGVGKTEGADAFTQAIDSVARHVFVLPPQTRVSPGHGDDTYVGREAPHVDEWRERGW